MVKKSTSVAIGIVAIGIGLQGLLFLMVLFFTPNISRTSFLMILFVSMLGWFLVHDFEKKREQNELGK